MCLASCGAEFGIAALCRERNALGIEVALLVTRISNTSLLPISYKKSFTSQTTWALRPIIETLQVLLPRLTEEGQRRAEAGPRPP